MYHPSLQEYIKRIVDFKPVELDTITRYFRERKVAKGEYVLRRGQVCRFEGFVTQGCFRIFITDHKGSEKVLYFAGRQWWVMDIDSFANQIPSELDIQAAEDSTLLVISREDKERLYREVPKVERLFRIMSQKAVVAWQRRLIQNHTMNAEERYIHFVTNYPEIAESLTNKLVASYLGITQEFVSVIRKRRSTNKT